jgi:AraC-like DNA-binding protein
MGIVAALLKSPEQMHRLRAAIRGRYPVSPCDDWDGVRRLCDAEPVSLAVLDLYAGGAMDLDPVRQLRRLYPRLVTVAYVSLAPDRVRDVFDAGRAGLDGLIIADHDDSPVELWAILEQAETRSVASGLRTALVGCDPTVRDAVLVAVTRAHENLSGDGLARLLSIPRRSLTKRLTLAGFPPPPRLLTWGRLIVAAQMLDDLNRSADAVSAALRFPSGSAFRNTCQRYVHATPTELRQRGGAEYVVSLLLAESDHTERRTAA